MVLEKKSNPSIELNKQPPDDIQIYVLGLHKTMRTNHLTLEQAEAEALAQVEASRSYDPHYSLAKNLTERAIQFLREQGIK